MINTLNGRYESIVRSVAPRLLTSVCRNSTSKFYGCFDRNWWHYKIRDFPSLILQQGAYAVSLLDNEELTRLGVSRDERDRVVEGAVDFWAQRANLRGYAEEYYPFEDGYPPLAFATLAMAKIVFNGRKLVFTESVKTAFSISARKLLSRFESNVGNQQVAGLAALFYIKRLYPELIDDISLATIMSRTLSLQHDEGWFFEYDGADLGYLSVTLECLYDIYDCSKSPQILNSIKKCVKFSSCLIRICDGHLSGLNSRNTDYILPYGYLRGYFDGDRTVSEQCAFVLTRLALDDIFSSIDDRYWSHYIGHSLIRASNMINSKNFEERKFPQVALAAKSMPGAGLIWIGMLGNFKVSLSAFKGGTLCISEHPGREFYDYGWVIGINKKKFTTYWFSRDFEFTKTKVGVTVKGMLYPETEFIATPLNHTVLRAFSFFFGRKIVSLLKNKMIFRKSSRGATFTRKIELKNDCLVVRDLINLAKKDPGVITSYQRASKFSTRHVASAGSFCSIGSIQDWNPDLKVEAKKKHNQLRIVTELKLLPES